MASYVNDLRLKEIGTGESSGTWGTETNTNLELIGDALGFGTEAITTNADTHTTTVADGSADAGRAMYIKYTGALDSACTITIGPNTINRMHFIENATTGSQNIVISQGTGSNVTIPAGDVKAVYLDGAGSGAAVADAFASLNVVDLKVEDDLTVTDDASIGGDLTVTGSIAGTLSTAAQTNITSVGTLTTLTVDDITINGSTISDAGNMDFDIGGDLTIDVDGADIKFADGGTEFADHFKDGSDYKIQTTISDGDFIIVGNDGGSAVNALTLDMSDAGAATFNGVVTANAGVKVDNITIDGTEIDLSSGTLTLDAQDEIHLDADSGIIRIRDDGADIGMLRNESNDFTVRSMVSDQDMLFKGNDGGSVITALTLDMSEAGTAIFNQDVGVGITPAHLGRTGSGHVVHLDGDDCQVRLQNSIVHHDNSGNTTLFIRNNYASSGSDGLARITLEAGTQLFTTGTAYTERARITAGGQLLIGSSFTSPVGGETVLQAAGNSLSGGVVGFYDPDVSVSAGNVILQLTFTVDEDCTNGKFIQFSDGNTNCGSITAASATSVAYNTTSDERLKKNIVDVSPQLDVIKNIKVREFDWKTSNKHDIGMIAQELYKVIPNVVTEGSDEHKMNWGVDYGKLTPYLIKAVQELSETVDELKTEIQTLKGE